MTSTIKVDNIQDQDGNNIINENANTITIGASGDTVTLASGASQSGFGRTGTVDWDTTPKTASFTAVSGNGYFVNTTSSAITVTLPASPSAGNIVAVMDYANTAATNNITVARNSSKIDGEDIDATMKTNGQSFTLVYVDSTEGWKTVNNANEQINTTSFVAATGGTISTCGNFKVHTFTGPGCFTVTCAGNSGGSNTVDYFVVAGGGGGGAGCGGGGGAGGFRVSNSVGCIPAPTMSPLANPTGLPVSAQVYPITVGGGGVGRQFPPGGDGGNGSNSVFSTITSAGGGGGGGPGQPGVNGGSGGGRGPGTPVGSGNTPPVSPPQGFPGRPGPNGSGGGGAGGADPQPPGGGGVDGSFIAPAFGGCNGTPGPVGSVRYFAGGGSGNEKGTAGAGGGGPSVPSGTGPTACAGATNTGGGGGAWNGNPPGAGAGGSGIVIIRYKFQ
ncbi:hypothetical protein HTVC023P_gp60 [Pelagibacter phage HTVC023P]|nr:hypothetical protein HTVC023P_gp60 [Pelagibacter phage HTVC023P]